MMRFQKNFRKGQRGLSMLIALIALLILSITAVALVRSIDTGTLIIGNFAFKQDATEASSVGAERAITWLLNNQTKLDSDDAANGYYATSNDNFDPTGSTTTQAKPLMLANWDGTNCSNFKAGTYVGCSILPYPTAANLGTLTVNGNSIQWVITRLCLSPLPAGGGNFCSLPGGTGITSANDRGELTSGGRINSGSTGPYYRIIVRATGPRNTVSYTETLVHF
jgi:Tfp pilus assembly protein PilX